MEALTFTTHGNHLEAHLLLGQEKELLACEISSGELQAAAGQTSKWSPASPSELFKIFICMC